MSINLVGILNSKFFIDWGLNSAGKLLTFLNEINVKIVTSEKIIVFLKNLILFVKKKIIYKNKPLKIPKTGALELLKISEGTRKNIGK